MSLAVLWYGKYGQSLPEVQRRRPWSVAVGTTLTAMLGKLRLAIWGQRLSAEMGEKSRDTHPLENLRHGLAAVR